MSLKEFITSSYIWEYITLLTGFMPRKFSATLALMVIISLSEGIGLLLLIPLLQLVGLDVQQGALGQIATIIASFFSYLHITPTLGLVLLIYVLIISSNAFLMRLQSRKASEIQYEFASFLRKHLFKAITHSQWLFFSKKRSSDLAHALTNEIDRISVGTNQFLSLLASTFVLAVYIIFALEISGLITGLVFLVGIILLLFLRKKTTSSQTYGEELSTATRDMYSSTLQQLEGMKTIKSFHMEKENVANFSKVADGVASKYVDTINSYADVRFYFDVGSVITLSVIVFILIEVISISTAELLLLLFLFVRMIPRFSTIQRSYQYFINMIPAFVSVQSLEKECERAAESNGEIVKEEMRGDITFEDVSFSYGDGSFSIKNLDLKIAKGKTTALVGLSGGGKSTIADLVMGLITPDEGQISVGGELLGSQNILSWRQHLGYVAQDTFLFNDTVRNNLLLAKSQASDEELKNVLRLASAEFVDKLPSGLDTILGDRGVRLSGGERQRLALARALLREPSILILDEATSNLDSQNETKILSSVENLHGDVTILMIAHRLSTIRQADKIYLIKEGEVVESGGWDELTAKEGEFKSLFDAQKMDIKY